MRTGVLIGVLGLLGGMALGLDEAGWSLLDMLLIVSAPAAIEGWFRLESAKFQYGAAHWLAEHGSSGDDD